MDTHFRQQEWIDFVRGVLREERAGELLTHLQDACAECVESEALWRQVASLAAGEEQYQPPPDVVRSINGLIALQQLPVRGWGMRLASILFDSALQPAVAGVRAGAAQGRQLILDAGELRIEVTLNHHTPGEGDLAITGQIVDPDDALAEFAGTRVLFVQDDTPWQETTASRYGEFFLMGRADRPGWLVVDAAGRSPVAATLPATEAY